MRSNCMHRDSMMACKSIIAATFHSIRQTCATESRCEMRTTHVTSRQRKLTPKLSLMLCACPSLSDAPEL